METSRIKASSRCTGSGRFSGATADSATQTVTHCLHIPHRNLEYLFLSDLPGITDKQVMVTRLQTALPRLDVSLDLG